MPCGTIVRHKSRAREATVPRRESQPNQYGKDMKSGFVTCVEKTRNDMARLAPPNSEGRPRFSPPWRYARHDYHQRVGSAALWFYHRSCFRKKTSWNRAKTGRLRHEKFGGFKNFLYLCRVNGSVRYGVHYQLVRGKMDLCFNAFFENDDSRENVAM